MKCRELFLTQVPEQTVRHAVYLFDGFQLDVSRRKLISSGGLVQPLNSRAMETLLLLVKNAGELVEKRRLMQAVWPNAIVEDNNLTQCVLAIRKALGEAAGSNRYIMTVPGRGYRFVSPVREVVQESSSDSVITPISRPRTRHAMLGTAATICALLLLVPLMKFARMEGDVAPKPQAASVATGPVSSETVVGLRALTLQNAYSTGYDSVDVLARCLASHPDLRLRVHIQILSDDGSTLWTGELAEGARKLLSFQTSSVGLAPTCGDLMGLNRTSHSSLVPR